MPKIGSCKHTNLFFWSTEDEEKARVFMLSKFFHDCIILGGKARAYQSGEKYSTAFGLTCNYY